MSGCYLIEIVPRDSSKPTIIKFGSSRKEEVKYRIQQVFDANFNKNEYSYYILDTLYANESLAINIENLLINNFTSTYGMVPYKGREWFEVNEDQYKHVTDIVKRIPSIVLGYYESRKSLSMADYSISGVIQAKRKLLGLTQQELSSMSKLRQVTISDIENGKIGNFRTLKNVCDCLSLNITIL